MRYALLLISMLFVVPAARADVSVPRAVQYLWTVFDTATQGGASVAHPMGVSVPSGVVILGEYVYINTQFAAAGTESIGVSCVGSQDLMAYSSIKSIAADRMFSGGISNTAFNGSAAPINAAAVPLNLSQGFGSVQSPCQVIVNVRGNSGDTPYTSGKLTLILSYFKL